MSRAACVDRPGPQPIVTYVLIVQYSLYAYAEMV